MQLELFDVNLIAFRSVFLSMLSSFLRVKPSKHNTSKLSHFYLLTDGRS